MPLGRREIAEIAESLVRIRIAGLLKVRGGSCLIRSGCSKWRSNDGHSDDRRSSDGKSREVGTRGSDGKMPDDRKSDDVPINHSDAIETLERAKML